MSLTELTIEQLKVIAWDLSETVRVLGQRIEAVRHELERRNNDEPSADSAK